MNHILIIEDNPSISDFLAHILSKENYFIQVAKDGKSAFEKIKNQEFDLILLDLILPDISGLQILKKIRQKFSADLLPVIVISAVDDEEQIKEVLTQGANDFISKPFSELILKIKVKNLLTIQLKSKQINSQNKVLEDVIENIPIVTFLVDENVRILKANHASETLANKSKEKIIGEIGGNALRCLQAIKNADNCGICTICNDCAIRHSVTHTFNTGQSVNRAYGSFSSFQFEQSFQFDFLVSTTLIHSDDNKLVLLSIEDVTSERKALKEAKTAGERYAKTATELHEISLDLEKTNKQLFREKEKLAAIFNTINVGFSITDSKGKYVMLNNWWKDHLGYTHEQITNMRIHDITHPDDQELTRIRFEQIVKGEISQYCFDKRFIRSDGSVFWGDLSVSAVKDEKDNVELVIGVIRDITNLKQAEASLLKSEAVLIEAQKIGNTAHWEFDLISGNFTCSEQAYSIFDLDSANTHIDYKTFIGFFDSEDRALFEKNYQESIQKMTEFHLEHRIITACGNIKHVSQKAMTHYDNNGQALLTLGSIADITERKLAELKIAQQNQELISLNITKDKFFSIVSHDLKNAFISILGLSEWILSNEASHLNAELQHYLSMIHSTSKKTFTLLENLLKWARCQQGRVLFLPSKARLYNIVNETIQLLENQANIKNISIESHINTDFILIADSEMVKTILRNLINNAIKFTPSGGKITLKATQEAHGSQITVCDTGRGMDQKTRENLFNIALTQSQRGTEGEQGTGMGLILCYEFVKKHGGKIWVNSEIDKGTCIHFTIPDHVQPIE